MILEFIVKVNGENVYLDVHDGKPMSLNFNIADINNIESKNSSYSKTISLPDSKVNREAFKHIFQLNSDSDFDPTKKSKCWILKDTVIQFEGNLQLTNIIYDNNANINGYEAVIYSDNDTLYKNIGEKFLNDLDLSAYDHSYTYNNVIASFTKNYDNGYYYPLIDYGWPLSKSYLINDLNIFNLYPSVYVKTIVDQIFLEAGYGYTSDFLNSPEFERLVIPFTNKEFLPTIYNTTTDSNDNIFIATQSGTVSATSSYFNSSFWSSFNQNVDLYDPNNVYNTTGYYYENNINAVINQRFRIDIDMNITDCGAPATTGEPWTGILSDDVYIFVKRSRDPITGVTVSGWSNTPTFQELLVPPSEWPSIAFNGSKYKSLRLAIGNEITLTDLGSGLYRLTGSIYTDYLTQYPLFYGEQVRFFFMRYGVLQTLPAGYRLSTNVGTMISSGVDRKNIAYGGDISISSNLPNNLKQKDFLTSIFKMFNLYMEPEIDKINSFIIEPRDYYYNKYQVVKDWSNKLDVSKKITSIFTSNQQSRTNLFTYKSDKDYYNTDYTNQTKEILGQYKFDIDNDFIKGENKIELVFSPTPIDLIANTKTTSASSGIYVPKIVSYNNGVYTTVGGVNPRILYSRPITIDPTNTIKLGTYSLSVYPYAGYSSDPINPTYSINFGQVNTFYPGSNETINNLFYNYYQNQMIEISDKNSRIVTAYFNLTSVDISQFRFSDLILFRLNGTDGYYRVNKIINYDPGANQTTQVELIKATNYNIPKSNYLPSSSTIVVSSSNSNTIVSSVGNVSTANGNISIGDQNIASFEGGNIISGDNNVVVGNNNLVLGKNMDISDSNSIYLNDGTSQQLKISTSNRSITGSSYSYTESYDTLKKVDSFFGNPTFNSNFINKIGSHDDLGLITYYGPGATASSLSWKACGNQIEANIFVDLNFLGATGPGSGTSFDIDLRNLNPNYATNSNCAATIFVTTNILHNNASISAKSSIYGIWAFDGNAIVVPMQQLYSIGNTLDTRYINLNVYDITYYLFQVILTPGLNYNNGGNMIQAGVSVKIIATYA